MKHISFSTRTSASKPPSIKKANAVPIERGLTNRVPASILKTRIEFRALVCLNRFRYVRTIDIAIDCFSERPYTAARHAARLAIRNLLKAGYALKYRTKRHHTIYALTAAGAARLDAMSHGSITGRASIRAAARLTNPEHLLWGNFIVLSCEARGIHALSESELKDELSPAWREDSGLAAGLLSLKAHSKVRPKADAAPKSVRLRPDALAFESNGLTWFEVDASRRSDTRRARLLALVRALGTELPSLQSAAARIDSSAVLAQVVIIALEPALLNRLRSLLDDEVASQNQTVLTEDSRNSRLMKVAMTKSTDVNTRTTPLAHTYELWKARYNAEGTHQVDACVGRVVLQCAPTWLPNYQGSDATKRETFGWFDENYLPYCRPSSLSQWPAARTPTDFLS